MTFREIENLMPLKEHADKDQDVLDFVEGSSLVLLFASFYENIGGRRFRDPW
jgi:hypothetical protein